jgi:hypothetical protein
MRIECACANDKFHIKASLLCLKSLYNRPVAGQRAATLRVGLKYEHADVMKCQGSIRNKTTLT